MDRSFSPFADEESSRRDCTSVNRVGVQYQVFAGENEIESLVESIRWEQSVEVPPSLLPQSLHEKVLGDVIRIDPLGSGSYEVELSYPEELCAGGLGCLLNLLYGNVSIFPGVRLIDFELPEDLAIRVGHSREYRNVAV